MVILSEHTGCTLHNALINKPKIYLSNVHFVPGEPFNISDKAIILFSTLIFIVSNCNDLQFQNIHYQWFMVIKACASVNNNSIIY